MRAIAGWDLVTVEECCEILDSKRVPVNAEDRDTRIGDYPYYGANGLQGYIDDFIFDEPLILIAEDGGGFDEFATHPIAYRISGKSWVNNHAHVLRAREPFCQDAVFYSLEHKDIQSFIVGGTRAKLNQSALRTVTLFLPTSKPEQARIAEVLSTIDKAIEQTEALIAKQQRIKTGLMQDLLTRGIDEHGNPRSEQTHVFKDSAMGRIPADWDAMSLGDIAEILDPNPSHRYPPRCDTGVPIASTENFEADNEFDLTGCENVPRSVFEEQLRRCRYQPADVVFARKGRIGLARPYGSAEKVFSHTVVIIKARETDRVVTEFLLWVVRNHEFFKQIDKRMNSNSGVPTLGVQFLAAIPILVPRPPEQQRIVQVMSQVEGVINREQNSLRKLRSHKTGLMQDLLTGRKRVTALLEPEPKHEKIYAQH